VVDNVARNIAVPEALETMGPNLDLVPIAFIELRSESTAHALSPMNLVCTACQALHWPAEKQQNPYRARAGTFQACCKHGDLIVERMRALPEPVNTLMTGQDRRSRLFRHHIPHWNTLFAFTSLSFNADARTGATGLGLQLFRSMLLSMTSKVLWFYHGAGIPCTRRYIYMIQIRLLK